MIRLRESALHAMHEHAVRTYPDEACGILLGTVEGLHKTVVVAAPIENRAASSTRYLMTASDYQWAEKHAEDNRLRLVGIYHSHPDHPALPSERDRSEALPFFSYVIVSVVAAEPTKARSFVLSDDRVRFNEEPIVLLESDPKRQRGELTCP